LGGGERPATGAKGPAYRKLLDFTSPQLDAPIIFTVDTERYRFAAANHPGLERCSGIREPENHPKSFFPVVGEGHLSDPAVGVNLIPRPRVDRHKQFAHLESYENVKNGTKLEVS
jgi:hypothetical protein